MHENLRGRLRRVRLRLGMKFFKRRAGQPSGEPAIPLLEAKAPDDCLAQSHLTMHLLRLT